MTAVLGIDAAWTAHHPSGVALVHRHGARWRCAAVAPSYSTFAQLAEGRPVDWDAPKIVGEAPDVPRLLAAARSLLGGRDVDLVAIDMPIATGPITRRRAADDAISRAFSAAWCSAHSPTETRPGALGRQLTEDLVARGYAVAVDDGRRPARALLEVYPHPALLALMKRPRRLPYKIGKPGRVVDEVRTLWVAILAALQSEIDGIDLIVPASATKARMKRHEDALDALVCAWSGIAYAEGWARPFGDATAAVWCPDPGRAGAK